MACTVIGPNVYEDKSTVHETQTRSDIKHRTKKFVDSFVANFLLSLSVEKKSITVLQKM